MSKAQIATTDLFLAITIFLILITAFFVTWNVYQSRLTNSISRSEMELYAVQVANQLVRSPGIPADWENNVAGIRAIGLSGGDRVISEEKLNAFANLTAEQMGSLNIGSYNFYFILIRGDNAVLEVGAYPAGQSVTIRRNVIYQNEASTVQVSLWE